MDFKTAVTLLATWLEEQREAEMLVKQKREKRSIHIQALTDLETAQWVHDQADERDWSPSKFIHHILSKEKQRSDDANYLSGECDDDRDTTYMSQTETLDK